MWRPNKCLAPSLQPFIGYTRTDKQTNDRQTSQVYIYRSASLSTKRRVSRVMFRITVWSFSNIKIFPKMNSRYYYFNSKLFSRSHFIYFFLWVSICIQYLRKFKILKIWKFILVFYIKAKLDSGFGSKAPYKSLRYISL